MRYCALFVVFFAAMASFSQDIIGTELLDKAIAYHDPSGHWKSFNDSFTVTMETPNSSNRISTITLDLPKSKFKLAVTKDENTYAYNIMGEQCIISLNGTTDISKDDLEKYRLSCERGNMLKNYYSYLYGLPMKLKDKGTVIDPNVSKKTFKGKEYLVLKVSYDKEVGEDTWYFYFDPFSYAMEVYQFFHDETKNDGEYILLSGIEEINGIKMPKNRKWFFNKDDTFLGIDILE